MQRDAQNRIRAPTHTPHKGSLGRYKEHSSGVGCGSPTRTPCFLSGFQGAEMGPEDAEWAS